MRKNPRILVCGSRNWSDKTMIYNVLNTISKATNGISLLIEGEAKGADTIAKQWAKDNNIPILPFPAQWKRYGSKAGYLRNAQMLTEGRPDYVIAFTTGSAITPGTRHTVILAHSMGITTTVYHSDNPPEFD